MHNPSNNSIPARGHSYQLLLGDFVSAAAPPAFLVLFSCSYCSFSAWCVLVSVGDSSPSPSPAVCEGDAFAFWIFGSFLAARRVVTKKSH
jgi:hypothetical protein